MAARSGVRWEMWEDTEVESLFRNGYNLENIAALIKRTEKAVFLRLRDIHGLIPPDVSLVDDYKRALVNTTEENKVEDRTVKQVTYVGNKKAEDFSIEELLTIIEEQESFASRLEKLKRTEAIANLIQKHRVNIEELTKLVGELA